MIDHLRVPREMAQNAIERARRLGIVDYNFSIQNDAEYVLIPLVNGAVSEAEYPTVKAPGRPAQKKYQPLGTHGAFDVIGHIAITKIRNRDRAVSLAEALISTNRSITTVYLDTGIQGEYRIRNLELLAGTDNPVAVYRENGVAMTMDVRKVYFSPRLATERMLVSKDARDGEEILDMFSGIGPFSMNIARWHNCTVHAIDSNPDAIFYMQRSIMMNRLIGRVIPHNADVENALSEMNKFNRIIMNLPHDSFRYLGVALEHLNHGGILHYYEILDVASLEERMEELRSRSLELLQKRVVHGYSSRESMFALWLRKA
ncbi:MAG: class I SAM-dependent methyltransferase family protein [Thermoplasmataceae archaeon]